MKIFQWRYSLFLMLFALCLSAGSAQAANIPGVTCIAGMNTTPGGTGVVNLGTITPANADSASITGTLNYSCTNTGTTAGYVSVCLAVDGGSYQNSPIYPRYMVGPNPSLLAFTMTYPSGSLWGSRNYTPGSDYNSGPLTIARRPGGGATSTTITGSVVINISLLSGLGNVNATVGSYTNNFNGGHTAIAYKADTVSGSSNCSTASFGSTSAYRFPFEVTANILPECKITATSDIELGPRSASETNIAGSESAIEVTCTNTTPYYIGLAPSNGNTTGAGFMSGAGGDSVPYQLRSTAGMGGTVWGNTATSVSVGNGVAGTGSGGPQTKTVYVTVPSADFKPDNYSDTVTVRVNY